MGTMAPGAEGRPPGQMEVRGAAGRASWGLRRIHLLLGTAALAAFLWTGLFMDRRLEHLVAMPDAPRALYRSGHIYLLFSALLNLALGAYLAPAAGRVTRGLQYSGSGLLFVAPALLLYGFFVETPTAVVERPMVRAAIESSFAGVLLHVASVLVARRGTRLP